jgi:hypothetical protein
MDFLNQIARADVLLCAIALRTRAMVATQNLKDFAAMDVTTENRLANSPMQHA